MKQLFESLGFGPAEILLPKTDDMTAWSVVACDQYTSEPQYWDRVEKRVGDKPSTLRLILPEQKLDGGNQTQMTMDINHTMEKYLQEDLFETYPDCLIYVERTLDSGRIRRGIVGQADMEAYDYHAGASSLIRATEKTVLDRIPPRVEIRRYASLELPHVMMLMDDASCTIIEQLAKEKDQMKMVYDFDLMERGGHIAGYLMNRKQMERLSQELQALADPKLFEEKYNAGGKAPLLFAVGDGNHSLASAKVNYIQKSGSAEEARARYALVELVNLHDSSLEFEAIHRVCFGLDTEAMLAAMKTEWPGMTVSEMAPQGGQKKNTAEVTPQEGQEKSVSEETHAEDEKSQSFCMVTAEKDLLITIPEPTSQLTVGTLQKFLDAYAAEAGFKIDYIHGEDVVRSLASQPDNVGFLLEPMKKSELYPTVIHDGVLPRKTFSMGEAHDKRFYLEARRL